MTGLWNTILSTFSWPLSVRPSLQNLADPEARRTIALALTELGGALLLLTLALAARRARLVALLVAMTALFLQGPSLLVLLVPATPTSYRPSPVGFTTEVIADGRRAFAANCTPCHGKQANGVGGLGDIANLHLPHIWSHPIGDLFWYVSHGISEPGGTPSMPAFESVLPERTRWSAITYVRAMNAGAVTRGLEGWPQALLAPPIAISCASLPARGTAELRGKAVRIILGTPPVPLTAVPPVDGIPVITVWLPGPDNELAPTAGIDCVARGDADAAMAYAILAGSADGHVIPARFLIDPDGVLRSVWRKEDGEPWADQDRLLEEVRTICTEHLAIGAGEAHEHHH